MKTKIAILFLITNLLVSTGITQTFEIRIIENSYGYLEVQMKETSGTGTPTTSTLINDISFEIRWLTTLSTDVAVICSSNNYNLADALGITQTNGSYTYRVFQATTTPLNPPENWVLNTWMTITTFKSTSGSGSGSFEIAPDGWVVQGLNWNQGNPPVDYTPTVNGQADSYSYPTIVYDLVWTGNGTDNGFQNEHSWGLAGNWSDECGSAGSVPGSSDNCYIPSGVTNYPENVNKAFAVGTGTANNVRIENGGSVSFGLQSNQGELLNITGELNVYGSLTINEDAGVTVGGSTYIDCAECLVVAASSLGIGSYIDNGTITYGGSGTAKVQTYLSNSAGSGNFDIHMIGTTVDKISGGTDGAYLSAFNLVNGNTYAYEWDETQSSANGWQNIYDNDYVVTTASGIGLSTDDGSSNTLELTGELTTGNISSPSLTYSNNHNELISNPYPSSIDFDNLASDNSSVVQNKYWIWNPVSNNYTTRAAGSGGSRYIQVGQGFFVETKQSGTFNFTNSRRLHSNDAFRSSTSNILTMVSTGGMEGYSDESIIRFDENASDGYDIEIEAVKWTSQNGDATMINSISEDQTKLAINVLPLESLNGEMTSVPVYFNCGYSDNYSLSFYDIESFDTDTEIWLEDKVINSDWILINDYPDYVFSASSDDPEDRFVIHFFGPTAIDELNNEGSIDIYGYRHNAYVRNNTNEHIKSIEIYNLAGELVTSIENVDDKFSGYWVSESMGYYIVKVVSTERVTIGKVFISK
jgi:hypothetical protein